MGEIERIEVPAADRDRLANLVRDRNTPQKVVSRARIVLLTGEGLRATEVAVRVGTSTLTVRRWRYAQAGVEGLLKDATRPPGRKPLSTAVIQRVLGMTLHGPSYSASDKNEGREKAYASGQVGVRQRPHQSAASAV
jgi:Homeodomain-like domain